MDSTSAGLVIIPGGVALVFLLVLAYLKTGIGDPLVRLWQAAWGCYFGHALATYVHLSNGSPGALALSHVLLVLTALALVASSRAIFHDFRLHWSDGALLVAGVAWTVWNYQHSGSPLPARVSIDVGIAALMVYAAGTFYRAGKIRESLGMRLLAAALCIWAGLLSAQQFHELLPQWLSSAATWAGPLPRLLLGLSMVMVMFENERRTMQDNALVFSTLDVDNRSLLTPDDLAPALRKMLERVLRLIKTERGLLCTLDEWRGLLPSVQSGYTDEFLAELEQRQIVEILGELAYRRGGLATFRNLPTLSDPILLRGVEVSERLKSALSARRIRALTAVSLQTRNSKVGVLIIPHVDDRPFSTGQLRLLLAVAMQIGTTLENHILVQQAQRRTKEYELLTQIGQVVSSHLDPDDVLRAIHAELGKLFDTGTFYIAFESDGELHFEFEVREGEVQPKRSRKLTNALTEHILRTGQPLLIRSEIDSFRKRTGLEHSGLAKSYAGVPIRMGGRPTGVMAAMHFEREFVYDQRDLELLQTSAGQLAVAMENARLFAGEQERSRYLEFLNSISKTAISSQDAEQMLAEIVGGIEKNFRFDHVGVGLLDYATKEIEIKAEGGTVHGMRGRRIPLGNGILGKVARTGEMVLIRYAGDTTLPALLPDAASVVCMPLTYSEMLLGVLNVESRNEDAFSEEEVLLLRTVADLLATALHNAFIFQKMQQQSITDGLTGIKTRRFFMEALQSEWKRASRSGRPFSVVLIDLDRFKEVNDSMGHLEGDLVLARVGRLLEQKSRQSNVVARYGGDEFVILMPETGADQAHILSERLRLWVAADPMLADRKVTASFGVATFPIHATTVDEIIRVADSAMYASKHFGGNRVSAVQEDGPAAAAIVHNQQLLAYVEGFLHREDSGPEYIDELIATLKRLCSPDGALNAESLLDAIKTLNRASEAREDTGSGHGDYVARYAGIIGRELGLPADELSDLTLAATVHDVGKILVPDKVLSKAGLLSEREYELLQMHAQMGASIVGALPGSTRLQAFIRHHHERVDGSGYPTGLKGDEIPLGARIIGLADTYVNMISEHAFSPAKSEAEALRELEAQSGTHFDGMLVRILAAKLRGEHAATAGK